MVKKKYHLAPHGKLQFTNLKQKKHLSWAIEYIQSTATLGEVNSTEYHDYMECFLEEEHKDDIIYNNL